MSKIEEMIKRLCPNGVERWLVGDIIEYHPGGSLTRHQVKKEGLYPVMNGGTDYSGFYDSFNYDENVLTISHWGSSASHIHRHNNRFWANNACWIFTPKKDSNCLLGYLYYILKTKENIMASKYCFGGATPNLNRQLFERMEIPLPPLSIQREIVSVLDSFTMLIDKMKQEVELRKKQMEYYREKLLSFEGEECDWNTLKELFVIKNGLNKEKKDFGIGTPIINYVDVYKNRGLHKDDIKGLVNSNESELSRFKCTKGDVFFTRTSETKEEVGFPSVLLDDIENCVFSGFLLKATPITDKLDAHYCKYCFFTNQFRQEVEKRATLTTRALTNSTSLYKISIPIPPLSTQHSIVSTLDAFEQYISKLERLITLREKQYAYYREKLLTFE